MLNGTLEARAVHGFCATEGDPVRIGPPGPFVEDGVIVLGPLGSSGAAPLASLDATFTIMSNTGDVSGEKHLLATVPADFGVCESAFDALVHSSQLCYRARFGDGSTETGHSTLDLEVDKDDKGIAFFTEDFVADPTVSCQGKGEEKVTLCHHPPGNPDNGHTIEVGVSAVPHHLGHGDTPGACLP